MAEFHQHKAVASTCFRWLEWTSSKDLKLKRGQKPAPSARGVLAYSFRKPGYVYVCKRRMMQYSTWLKFLNSSSRGKFYNFYVRGKY